MLVNHPTVRDRSMFGKISSRPCPSILIMRDRDPVHREKACTSAVSKSSLIWARKALWTSCNNLCVSSTLSETDIVWLVDSTLAPPEKSTGSEGGLKKACDSQKSFSFSRSGDCA